MKILHVITGLDVGGAETMLYRLVSHMDVVRFQSRVVSLIPPGPMGAKIEEAGVRVDSLGMRRGVPSPAGLYRLTKIIRKWRPDVVQTWLYHADLAGLVAARLAFPLGDGPKIAWNIRCSFMALEEYRRMTGATLNVCARLSGLPDVVVTNSNEARRFHGELGYAPKRFEVIPNGFDTERFRPDAEARREIREELSIAEDDVVVGHVARFDAMKDHRTMLKAAAQTPGRPVYVLAGRGVDYDNLELAAWMAESGLDSQQVRLLGEREGVNRLMAAMDVHVSSSLGESFPNVVGESMACGVVNVVTDVGDSAYLVGETGVVVPPGDPQALSEAIARIVEKSVRERETMGAAAREKIITRFSLASVIATYEALYEDLSGKA